MCSNLGKSFQSDDCWSCSEATANGYLNQGNKDISTAMFIHFSLDCTGTHKYAIQETQSTHKKNGVIPTIIGAKYPFWWVNGVSRIVKTEQEWYHGYHECGSGQSRSFIILLPPKIRGFRNSFPYKPFFHFRSQASVLENLLHPSFF